MHGCHNLTLCFTVDLGQACFVSQSSLEPLLVLILLASTDLECNFINFYQTVLQGAQIASQIVWQFVSAAMTDKTESWAQWFLALTLVVQTGCDFAMYFFGHNRWVLLVLYIVRFALVQQIGNSVGKIFKMRIQLVMKLEPDEQMSAFNILSVTGDFLGRFISVVAVYVVALALNNSGKMTYPLLRNMFFVGLLGWDFIALVCTLSIRMSYYQPPVDPIDPSIESRLDTPKKRPSINDGRDFVPPVMLSDSASGSDGEHISRESKNLLSDNNPYGSYRSEKDDMIARYGGIASGAEDPYMSSNEIDAPLLNGIVDENAATPVDTDAMGSREYLVYAIKSTVYNRPLLLSLVHLWTVTTLLAFVTIVLRFDVTTQGTNDKKPVPANFCGGILINLIETQVASEVCRLLGALLYQFYMNQISPLHFYRVVYVVYGVLNAFLLFVVIWPIGSMPGSIVLGAITVFVYLSMVYSANITSAVMDSSMAGFVFGVQGSGLQIFATIPIFTMLISSRWPIPTAFITGYCVCHSLASAVFSIWFALTTKKDLDVLNDGSKPSKSKFKRCLLGY